VPIVCQPKNLAVIVCLFSRTASAPICQKLPAACLA